MCLDLPNEDGELLRGRTSVGERLEECDCADRFVYEQETGEAGRCEHRQRGLPVSEDRYRNMLQLEVSH